MLNPIKSPMDMLMEQSHIPHYDKGGRTGVAADVLGQFAGRIQEAIRKYTKLAGKPPSPEEVKQLEEYLTSLKQPTGHPAQTQARLQAETPAANQLVDKSGRPYSTMPHPQTGVPITPERALGYTVQDQFGTTPMNAAARKSVMEPHAKSVFPEDDFMSMANTGRTSNRTWNKSVTPSTEDLAARQYADEAASMADETTQGVQDLGSYTLEQGPRSASAPFAETSTALESGPLSQIRGDLSPVLFPKSGEQPSGPMVKTVQQVIADFRARGIEPDKEDIVNAINAQVNPLRHNYTGENPIGLRPSGRAGIEDWRDQMRASGQPESVITKHPSDWKPSHKAEYLTDTTPENRGTFAADWNLEDQIDRRRIQHKAAGGMISPRDMQAQMMVSGYDRGGQITRRSDYETQPDLLAHLRNPDGSIRRYVPSARERISRTGADFLAQHGVGRDTARRIADTAIGGRESYLPYGFGVTDAAAMSNIIPNPVGAAAAGLMAPMYAEEAGRALAQGSPLEAASYGIPYISKAMQGIARPVLKAANVNPTGEGMPSSYRSVLERNYD